MTILYSCNQNYVNQTMISIFSVIEHNPVQIDFILVCDKLSDSDRDRIRKLVETRGNKICFKEIDSIPEVKDIETDGVHPRSIYAKLFPDRLTNAERILYLDSDVLANDALTELFSIDLGENIIAGTIMPYPDFVLKRQNIEGNSYICDGIVLLDVNKWKDKQLSEKAKEYIYNCHGNPERMSESVINWVCAGKVYVLPPKYNLMPQFLIFDSIKIKKMYQIQDYYSQAELEEARENPVLIHYMNELYNRPWCRKGKSGMWEHPYRDMYVKYQNELGISHEESPSLPVRAKITRCLFFCLPFPVFLIMFQKFHKY